MTAHLADGGKEGELGGRKKERSKIAPLFRLLTAGRGIHPMTIKAGPNILLASCSHYFQFWKCRIFPSKFVESCADTEEETVLCPEVIREGKKRYREEEEDSITERTDDRMERTSQNALP